MYENLKQLSDKFTKSSGMYGHFIHTEGLTPKQQQKLNDIIADIGKWRGQITKAQLDKGYEVTAGGSTNWRDDAIYTFIEKYPKLAERIWPGSTIRYTPPRGKRRFLKLLPGKRPPAEGYAVITTHNEALPADDPTLDDTAFNTMLNAWMKAHPPKFNVAVDAYTPLPRGFHEALADITEGQYQIPEGV